MATVEIARSQSEDQKVMQIVRFETGYLGCINVAHHSYHEKQIIDIPNASD